jgi:hypothetical protein
MTVICFAYLYLPKSDEVFALNLYVPPVAYTFDFCYLGGI